MSYSSFTSFVKIKIFPRKDKTVFNPFMHNAIKWPYFKNLAVWVTVRRSNLVKDELTKYKLFFPDGITPIHVKFAQDLDTIDACGPLREMFALFYEHVPQYLFCTKENQYVFRHDAHLVNNSDFENLGKLMAVGFLLGLPGPVIRVFLCHGIV